MKKAYFLMIISLFMLFSCAEKKEAPKLLSPVEKYQKQFGSLQKRLSDLRARIADENFDMSFSEDSPEKKMRREVGKANKAILHQKTKKLLTRVKDHRQRVQKNQDEKESRINELNILIEELEHFEKSFYGHLKMP